MAVIPGQAVTAYPLPDEELSPTSKNAVSNEAVCEGLNEIKNTLNHMENGVNENMTAGNAMQLNSNLYAEDQEPYLFRQTGGGVNAGTREIDTIVGGTVAWNQIQKHDRATNTTANVTYTNNNDGSFTLNGTANANSFFSPANGASSAKSVANHIYLAVTDIVNPSNNSLTVGMYINSALKVLGDTHNSLLYKATTTGDEIQMGFRWASGTNFSLLKVKGYLIDLTQMFGTAIADRAYALEQATAGSGIAWLKSMGFFTQDYYPYDTGTLKSVEGLQSHDMTGFNQWDEELEVGSIADSDGQNATNSNYRRTASYISVIPNLAYYFVLPNKYSVNGIYLYGPDKTYIKKYDGTYSSGFAYTIPDNVHFIRFRMATTESAVQYNHDICINISDPEKNGTYEPYQKHTYPLDSDLTLRGIPKLDANNKLYYNGDTYEADGSVTRRYGVVDLGTLTWSYNSGIKVFLAAYADIKPVSSANVEAGNIITSMYVATPYGYISNHLSEDKMIGLNDNATNVLRIRDLSYTDAAAFKVAMSGVYLVYELATPTTETADPFQTPQICDPSGTEEYVTTGIVPVGHETKYPVDQVKKLDNLPSDLSFVGPIENGATCQNANGYLQGQYFVKNNQFCKAKTAIASGATFTLNTNYEVTTVAAELYAAINS